jgi:tetratricopeptide (TPR) repeat protein
MMNEESPTTQDNVPPKVRHEIAPQAGAPNGTAAAQRPAVQRSAAQRSQSRDAAADNRGESDSGVEKLRREEKAAGLVMQARNMLRKGQRDQARVQLQQAFALNPADCGAFEVLGDIFLEEGEQQKAITVFERGRQHHPRHAAFEEKIALAHIDLAEMERDRILKEQLLADPAATLQGRTSDRKPISVAFLSLLAPGAGQYYNEEPERALVFFPVALLLLLAWAVPWLGNWSMGGFERVWIGVMLAIAVIWHVIAAVDAARSAQREIEEQKRLLGMA